MATSDPVGHDRLALWRSFAAGAVLQCPVCRGALSVDDQCFRCVSCAAVYPVESGVPLLMRPEEVASIPDQVMKVFNIPPTCKDQVETALTTLTRYRTYAHPEFANFFARFDGREGLAQTIPLAVQDTAAAVGAVTCLTHCFPDSLRADEAEFRSIRLRNGSDRVLFTDDRYPLYLSYRITKADGVPVPFEASRSPLPCPLRPGSELTVPVMVKLPEGATGQFVVRFYFLLANQPVAQPAPDIGAERPAGWLAALLGGLKPRPQTAPGDGAIVVPGADAHWFDASPLAEMTVTATAAATPFPAERRSGPGEFDVHEDVTRADAFLSAVIADLRSKGVARPRILEVGAGVYPIALRTCDEDTTVVVSDISLVMQTLAAIMHTNNPAVLGGRAGFASFDMMHPPFQDGAFDVICICAALHHIPAPDGFLKRLVPMLSAHGRFVAVREPCLVNPFEPTYIAELSNGFNEQMFELSEWREIIAAGGLEIDRAVIDFGCSLKFSARVPEAA